MKTDLILFLLCFISQFGFSQLCLDGNYCPAIGETSINACSGATDEYLDAAYNVVSTSPSSTCELGTVFLDIENSDPLHVYAYCGFSHGNGGNAYFRIYFNTDCDSSTGGQLAFESGTSGPQTSIGGAEYYLEIHGNGTLNDLFFWDTTTSDWIVDTGSGAQAMTGNFDGCGGSDDAFIEIKIPLYDLIGDVCSNNNTCTLLELTTVLSNAGGSANSNFCSSSPININTPVNHVPIAMFSIPEDTICIDTLLPLLVYDSIFLDASFSIDPDIYVDHDTLQYQWGTSAGGDTMFSNPSGIDVTDMNQISSYYYIHDLGTHQLSLTLTDKYGCDSTTSDSSSNQLTYSIYAIPSSYAYCNLRLPLDVINFDVTQLHEKAIELTWQYAKGSDGGRVEIERSVDNQEFERIESLDYVVGEIDQNSFSNYIDKNFGVAENSLAYRLRLTDKDGYVVYSNIQSISLHRSQMNRVRLVPNPLSAQTDYLRIENIGSYTKLSVFTISGRLVDTHVGENQQGLGDEMLLQTSDYPAGIYLIELTSNSEIETLKLMITE